MNNIKIPPYRLAYLDKLRNTRKPFAFKVAGCIQSLEKQNDMIIENILVDAIITIEEVADNYKEELIKYKMRFGELK